MSNEKIVSNEIFGILEPNITYSPELPLAGGVVKVKLTYEPREADKIIEIEQLSKPSKISFLCSFKSSVSSREKE